jgi:type I restriction enzyme R subunit
MDPEQRARKRIDELLGLAGWAVQDRAELDLGAARGVAVREFGVSAGEADYLLFVDRAAVGVIEAKKVGHTLTGVEEQNVKYRVGLPPGVAAARTPLPFAYESTGVETRFTNYLEPDARSRPVFAFHRPGTLAEWLTLAPEGVPAGENDLLRSRLRRLPLLEIEGLRDCQVEAITNLEKSFAKNLPRALIQMTMGSGKTFTSVSSVYRLIKYGGARRVLFLVDRSNLGRQALREFQQFETPDDHRKLGELYNIQHLQTNRIDPVARVCITTIQRLYSMLSGESELDPGAEEGSIFDVGDVLDRQPPKEVLYNPDVPIETFDVIITDECHRSIYHLWRGVLEYFDAFIVGLTATPNQQTFGFFARNLVMEYGHDRAVADGVNVDYEVYQIKTKITETGSQVERGFYVDRRDRQSRVKRWEQLDDDLVYAPNQLDREVVSPDQIRTVIRAFKDALATDLFPGRVDVPKTLIFAKDDSHADDIVQVVREEFGRGNEFAQKITYKTTGARPEDLLAAFRNSYNPRVAVTVDMISTGTDIKPLEALLFMRSVKSQSFFEQMKGRGSRTIADADFQAVTPNATKTRFVLVDAVGVVEQIKTDSPPLERKRSVAFEKLLDAVAVGARDDDILSSLAGRLGRLATRLTPAEAKEIESASGGLCVRNLADQLIAALEVDARIEEARRVTGEAEPDDAAVRAAARTLTDQAARPFDSPVLRKALASAQRRDEQTIDTVSQDDVIHAGWNKDADDKARALVTTFRQFIENHKDEIVALEVIYSRPRRARLTFNDVKKLAEAISRPPLSLTADRLWQAYEHLDRSRVRGVGTGRLLTDLVALVRYALERDADAAVTLEPFTETVNRRFTQWLADQEARRGKPFDPEQRRWLELIRDHIAASLAIEKDDFDYEPFVQRGGLGKAFQVFGAELDGILRELNEKLAA